MRALHLLLAYYLYGWTLFSPVCASKTLQMRSTKTRQMALTKNLDGTTPMEKSRSSRSTSSPMGTDQRSSWACSSRPLSQWSSSIVKGTASSWGRPVEGKLMYKQCLTTGRAIRLAVQNFSFNFDISPECFNFELAENVLVKIFS